MSLSVCKLSFAVSMVAVSTVGCSWQEPQRVEKDFGNSVRTMVAAQIFDPAAAHTPEAFGPDTLSGSAADAAIQGYQAASSQARAERNRTATSPIPVVGIANEK